MSDLHIALTVVSLTPVSVGAGGSAGTIADKSIVRDGWGRPIIPASQLKGRLRWGCEQILRGLGEHIPTPFDEDIERDTLVRRLFGSPQQRGALTFADLVGVVGAVQTPADLAALRDGVEQRQSAIRPSVAISRRRGIAEDARLLFQETALEGTRFFAESAVFGSVSDLAHVGLLWAALRLSTRWGGAKSRGLGWAKIEQSITVDGASLDDAALTEALRNLTAKGGA